MIGLLLRLATFMVAVYILNGSSTGDHRLNYLAINDSSSSSGYIFKSAETQAMMTMMVTKRRNDRDQWAIDKIHQHPAFYEYDSNDHNHHYYENNDDEEEEDSGEEEEDDDDEEEEEEDEIDRAKSSVTTIDLDNLNSNKPVRVLEFNDYISARNFSFNAKNRSFSASSDMIISNEEEEDVLSFDASSASNSQSFSRWWSKFQIRLISKVILCKNFIILPNPFFGFESKV